MIVSKIHLRKFLLPIFLIFFSFFVSSQKEGFIIKNTGKISENDIPFSIYKNPDGSYLFSSIINDSTILYKNFNPLDTTYLKVYFTNIKGELNGHYYHINKMKMTVSNRIYENGKIKSSLTLSILNNDTLCFQGKVNDSSYISYEKNDSIYNIIQTDSLFRENGYFKSYYVSNNKIAQIGKYRLISEEDIMDYKQFIKEYNRHRDSKLHFIPSFKYNNKLSIKIDDWYFYTENGELIHKETYSWKSIK
jgi:hypothetical protein